MSVRNIALGRYVYGESVIHRLDPRAKLVSMLFLMAGLFIWNGWTSLLAVFFFSITVSFLSGLPVFYIAKSLLPFKWLIIIAVLLNVIFTGGRILVEAPLPYGGITAEGLDYGILYGGRIALLVLLASLLTLTTEPIVLVDGIEKILSPLSRIGMKPQEIALAMVITIRFIPLLVEEGGKIRKSQIARGLKPGGSISSRLKAVTHLFLPLFHSAIRRAEALATAMDCRLYRSDAVRTRYREIKMSSRDWVSIAVSAGMVLIIFLIT